MIERCMKSLWLVVLLCFCAEVDAGVVGKINRKRFSELNAATSLEAAQKILSKYYPVAHDLDLGYLVVTRSMRDLRKLNPYAAQAILLRLGFDDHLVAAVLDSEGGPYELKDGQTPLRNKIAMGYGVVFGTLVAFPYVFVGLAGSIRLHSIGPLIQSLGSTPNLSQVVMGVIMAASFAALFEVKYPRNGPELLAEFVKVAKERSMVREDMPTPNLCAMTIRRLKTIMSRAAAGE